jgi:hypothetical protein
VQTVRIDPSAEDDCQYAGTVDEGARSLYSYQVGAGSWRHVIYGALTLFRDATERRAREGQNALPEYRSDVIAFPQVNVLNDDPSATFVGRLAGTVQPNVASYDRNVQLYPGSTNGQLCYLMTPDNSPKPRLAAVYVPPGIDWEQPIPVLTFLTPHTLNKTGPYPWSTDFNAMLDTYLVSGSKRLIAQINSSGRRCIFVLPIPLPQTFYGAIQQSTEMRTYLLEVVYWLQRKVGHQRFPRPRLGHCAVAAFSGGGNALGVLMRTAAMGGFDELKEIYGLDAVNADNGGYAPFAAALRAWWLRDQSSKRIRFYESDRAGTDWASIGADLGLRTRGRFVGGALEYQGTNATFAWLPSPFWQAIWAEDPSPRREVLGHFPYNNRTQMPIRPTDQSVHQVIPGVFLQHALANSAFERR